MLERIGPGASNAIPALIKATRRGDVLERRAPLDALAAIAPNDPRVRDILLKSLRDRRDDVRLFAAEALGTTRDSSRSVIDALEHTFHNDEAMEARLAAAGALLEIDPGLGPRLVAPLAELIELMEADDWQSPAWAARLLGRIGPDASSVVAALAGLLVHKYPNVRVAAAEALARVQPDRKTQSIELLRALLKHEQPSARLSAAKTLWRLSPEDATEIAAVATELLAARDIRPHAVRLLVEMGPAARSILPRLKQSLESGLNNREGRRAIWEAMEAIQEAK